MIFNSFSFIFLFIPVVAWGFYYLARKNNRWAIYWLTLASLFFYTTWDYRYLPILLTSISINYLACLWILSKNRAKSVWPLTISIAFNLILLCFFKYINFFIGSLNEITGNTLPLFQIILPIGISFFTFTQISVLVDAYHGKIKELRFAEYVLFASYFPYIVAGPILRQGELLPQFIETKRFTVNAHNFAAGISLFVFGLGKKLLIADNLSTAMAPVFYSDDPQFFQAWLGMLAYTLQLYFDFSGYSDMAIGVSRLLGFQIPINFNSPYKATSISDFWQRWHISLSQFLKNYLYIPLGGNRKGQLMRYRNLVLTMLLGGLWHGANWTFVIWGGLHGVYLCVQHGWQHLRVNRNQSSTALSRAASQVLTFMAVMIAWSFFRAPDPSSALAVLAGMAGQNGISLVTEIDGPAYWMLLASAFIAFCLPNTNEMCLFTDNREEKHHPYFSMLKPGWSPTLRWGLVVGCIFALCLLSIEKTNDFIYAQF